MPDLVSVVIPTYNRSRLVCGALDSVLRQTYPAVEVIVVDDGSTDDTAERLAAYGERIRVLRQPNAGVCAARNNGIGVAGGAFIAFLDSDDEWLPWKLSAQIAAFHQYPALQLTYTDAMVIDREGQFLFERCLRRYYGSYAYMPERELFDTFGELDLPVNLGKDAPAHVPMKISDFSSKIFLGNFFHLSTVMIRSSLIQFCGKFDESMGNAGEDYELFSRFAQAGLVGLLDVPAARCSIGGTDHLSGQSTVTALGNLKTMHCIEQRLQGRIGLPAALIRAHRHHALFWAGSALFDDDRPREARPYLWQALADGYLKPRGVVYWMLSFLPLSFIRRLRSWYHGVKQLRTRLTA